MLLFPYVINWLCYHWYSIWTGQPYKSTPLNNQMKHHLACEGRSWFSFYFVSAYSQAFRYECYDIMQWICISLVVLHYVSYFGTCVCIHMLELVYLLLQYGNNLWLWINLDCLLYILVFMHQSKLHRDSLIENWIISPTFFISE